MTSINVCTHFGYRGPRSVLRVVWAVTAPQLLPRTALNVNDFTVLGPQPATWMCACMPACGGCCRLLYAAQQLLAQPCAWKKTDVLVGCCLRPGDSGECAGVQSYLVRA